jgi:hypothetical protein
MPRKKSAAVQAAAQAEPVPAGQAAAQAAAVPAGYGWRVARSPGGRGRLRMVRVALNKDKNEKDVDAAKQVDDEAKAEEAADKADEESSDEADEENPDEELAKMEAEIAELRAKAEKLKEEKAKKKKKKAAPEKAAEEVEAPEPHEGPVAAAREGAATTAAGRVTASSGWAANAPYPMCAHD